MENKDINIESYDGDDAYYEGTDKDYEDFLKSVDGNINTDASPVSADDNGSVGGETINIRGVLDMVKKRAAKMVKDFKTASNEKEDDLPEEEIVFDVADDREPEADDKKNNVNIIRENISLSTKSAKEHIKNVTAGARVKLDEMRSAPPELVDKLDAITSKLNEIEVKQIEAKSDMAINIKDISSRLDAVSNDVNDVSQSVHIVSKLNDSMFRIKTTQQNIKKNLADVEASIAALKKKQVTTATVMSLLSVIIIVLEIVSLLS